MATAPYGAHVIDAIARPLSRLAQTTAAACIPLDSNAAAPRGLPARRSFDALVDVAGPSADAIVRSLAAMAADFAAYLVEERCLLMRPREKDRGGGVVLVSPVYRTRGIDHDAFDAHWRDRHAPLALRHHVGMWEYRQAVVVETLTETAPPFDGIARLGFPSLAKLETRLFDSREGRRIIAEDTARFVDLERSEAAVLREARLM